MNEEGGEARGKAKQKIFEAISQMKRMRRRSRRNSSRCRLEGNASDAVRHIILAKKAFRNEGSTDSMELPMMKRPGYVNIYMTRGGGGGGAGSTRGHHA